MQSFRVLVAEDHRIMRKSLSRFVDSQEDFTVVGDAEDGKAAVEMAHSLQPDVVLMDFTMPQMNGVEATREIRKQNPGIVVIGFSMFDDAKVEKSMRDAGAVAHLSKSRPAAELLSALREFAGLAAAERGRLEGQNLLAPS